MMRNLTREAGLTTFFLRQSFYSVCETVYTYKTGHL